MRVWTKKEKNMIGFSIIIMVLLMTSGAAYAMHIMEGYLPVVHCISWGAICIPFLAAGIISIRNTVQQNRRALILMAMSGAFIFVISSLKIPYVTGSSSHMTGTGLDWCFRIQVTRLLQEQLRKRSALGR